MITLVPVDWICASIDVCAPVPSATMVMTAATPMIMPSIVSAVRSLLRPSAFSATRKTMKIDIGLLEQLSGGFDGGRRKRRQLVVGQPSFGNRLVRDHHAVAERHDA